MGALYTKRVRARALGLLAGWRGAGVRCAVRPGFAEVLAQEAGVALAFRRSQEWVPLARVALEVARKLDAEARWARGVASRPPVASPGPRVLPGLPAPGELLVASRGLSRAGEGMPGPEAPGLGLWPPVASPGPGVPPRVGLPCPSAIVGPGGQGAPPAPSQPSPKENSK